MYRIDDLEVAARAALPTDAWDYYARGGFDELTLDDNRSAWRRWRLIPSVLVDVAARDPSTSVLGVHRAHPVLIAPSARHGLATPEAEFATARAAVASASVVTISIGSTHEPADIAATVPDASRWFQSCLFDDLSASRELAAMAAETGYEAIVLTVDNPTVGVRRHAAVTMEASSHARAATELPERLRRPAHERLGLNPSATWDDLAEFVHDVELPVLVKGVVTSGDAVRTRDAGAAGIIVSNHGGRQLDRGRPTADALPDVAEAVGHDIDVLVDGGIRSGIDVYIALALGADAVLIGRPVLWGLAVDGEAGAAAVITSLVHELDMAMALTGVTTVDRIDRTRIEPRTNAR